MLRMTENSINFYNEKGPVTSGFQFATKPYHHTIYRPLFAYSRLLPRYNIQEGEVQQKTLINGKVDWSDI